MATAPPTTKLQHNAARSVAVPPINTKDTATHMRSEKKVTPAPILSPPQKPPQKKISRRSSKPIINWFQRKLAGSVKGKRAENVPLRVSELGLGRNSSASGRQMGRITSSPLPHQGMYHARHQSRTDAASLARRKTRSISLYGDDELREQYLDDDNSIDQSSYNRDSIWSPASALEADDDASLRPIPPSAPPSPSPSRSSSSYLSDFRTFRSMAASTKPTTVLSIDLNGNGMAHIAQAPNPPPNQLSRIAPHVRQSSSLSSAGILSSGASITFSAIPTGQPSSRPGSLRNPGSVGSISLNMVQNPTHIGPLSAVQAPLHTTHHPRNNPRPSSPPLDNASVLTLASSAFGFPNRLQAQNYPPSAIGDSMSHYGGSTVFNDGESISHYVPGDDDRLEERDFDASVRALRPRSSRRGSWESGVSKWSVGPQGTPSLLVDRSLWTTNSLRTGTAQFSAENGDTFELADDQPRDVSSEGDDLSKCESPLEIAFQGVHITVEQPPVSPIAPESAFELNEIKEQSDDATLPSDEDNFNASSVVAPRASIDTIAHSATVNSNVNATPQHQTQQLSEKFPEIAEQELETRQPTVAEPLKLNA